MPYALSNLRDGEPPGIRAIRTPDEAGAGEAVVEDRPDPDHVWDASSGVLRPLTPGEELARAKAAKKAALAGEGQAHIAGLFQEGFEEKEVVGLLTQATVGAGLDDRLVIVAKTLGAVHAAHAEVDAIDPADPEAEAKIAAVTLPEVP